MDIKKSWTASVCPGIITFCRLCFLSLFLLGRYALHEDQVSGWNVTDATEDENGAEASNKNVADENEPDENSAKAADEDAANRNIAEEADENEPDGNSAGAAVEDAADGNRTEAADENAAAQDVRVQILNDADQDGFFDQVSVTCADSFLVERGMFADDFSILCDGSEKRNEFTVYDANEVYRITADELKEGEVLCIRPETGEPLTVTNLKRACGTPEYAGVFYLYALEEGLVLVNELDLETYLYAVVSSEMPQDFPMEALKAQAVCARTYALICIRRSREEKSMTDLDDSVSFQVYNNYESSECSREAVDMTRGETLPLDTIQYYSTSCLSEYRDDLADEEAFRAFLDETPQEEEYGSAWLRWEVTLPEDQLLTTLSEEYEITGDCLKSLSVVERKGNGQAVCLTVLVDSQTLTIEGEYEIRRFFVSRKGGN